jgi:hypothetical protein
MNDEEAPELYAVRIGSVWSPEDNLRLSDVGLTDQDLLGGVAVFGEEAPYTFQAIASQAASHGYSYLVLDFANRYRNLVYAVDRARVLEPGRDLTLNPFDGEELEPAGWVDLLITALNQGYRLWSRDRRSLRRIVLEACELAEGRVLTLREFEGMIMEVEGESTPQFASREALKEIVDLLVHGGGYEALSGPQTLPTSKLLSGLTVLELGEFPSLEFRAFLQALVCMKLYANRTTLPDRSIVLLDSAEALLPNRLSLTPEQRQPSFILYLEELRRRGVGIHISANKPSELDTAAFSLTGLRICHRVSGGSDIATIGRELKTSSHIHSLLRGLESNQALVSLPTGGDVFAAVLDHPSWLFLEPPTREQLEGAMERGGFPVERLRQEREAQVTKNLLERQFGEDAQIAYEALKALSGMEGVTITSLTQSMLGAHPQDRVLNVVRVLREYGFIGSKRVTKPHEMWLLKLTDKGARAMAEWESRGQSKLEDSERGGE